MIIRAATASDALQVARIHVDAWRSTYRGVIADAYLETLDPDQSEPRWRLAALAVPPELFVLDDDGTVVGFCHVAEANDDDTDESVGEITAIYIEPSATGRGYGRQLCQHALSELKARGFRDVVLWVLSANAGARAFYEKLGFALDGGQKFLKRLKVEGVRYRMRVA